MQRLYNKNSHKLLFHPCPHNEQQRSVIYYTLIIIATGITLDVQEKCTYVIYSYNNVNVTVNGKR